MRRFLLICGLLGLNALAAPSVSAQPVNSFIVKLKSATAPSLETPQALQLRDQQRALAVARDFGATQSTPEPVGTRAHLLRLDAAVQGPGLTQALQRLRQHSDVEWAEPNVRLKRTALPNDPGFTTQWHLQAPVSFASSLSMPLAWDKTTGASTATVAVLDTGIRFNHPDLVGRLHAGYDFVSEVAYANDGNGRDTDPSDPGDWVSSTDLRSSLYSGCMVEDSSWHGTFIAGQIVAAANNSQGITGINWNAKVLPVRVSGKCGALLSDILDAMRWAAGLSVSGVPVNPNPAKIINLSFGGDSACTKSYQDTIDEIGRAGALLVVAAGNSSGPLTRPADCTGVLAVAAVQADGAKTYYSDFGSNVAISAPGGDVTPTNLRIYSTSNSGAQGPVTDNYGYKIGTSFSAPLAAAVASLMLSMDGTLTPAQLIAKMKASARPHVSNSAYPQCSSGMTVACNCTTSTCGAGMLDANAAVALAALPEGSVPTATSTTVVTSSGGGGANGLFAGLGLWALALFALLSRRQRPTVK
jgi:serine protease